VASGAGLNRIGPQGGCPFFTVVRQGLEWASPIVGTTDSGPVGVEGIGFSKWGFQLLGTFTGFSVAIYGTLDPAAYLAWEAKIQGNTVPAVPATSWALLPAPDEETGTGGTATNPLVAAGVILPYNLSGLVAVRAVATASGATGRLQAVFFGIP
jgi:hypothetical protein